LFKLVPSNDKQLLILLSPLGARFWQRKKYPAIPIDQTSSIQKYGWNVVVLGVCLTTIAALLVMNGWLPQNKASFMSLASIVSSSMLLIISVKLTSLQKQNLEPDLEATTVTGLPSGTTAFLFCCLALAFGLIAAVS